MGAAFTMVEVSTLLGKLPPRHRQALDWFAEHAGGEIGWPAPLKSAEGETLLVTQAKGIYKPEWSNYALSVRQTLGSPYPDREPVVRSDGSWLYQYFQENPNPSARDAEFTNRALMACLQDQVPVAVMRQTKAKPGVRYNVLGLAVVAAWDDGYFFFEGFSPTGVGRGRGPQGELDLLAKASMEAEPEFDPAGVLDARRRVIASIVRRQGQAAFREALLDAYEGRCAISQYSAALEAAHIVPYRGKDSDHVQNGLLLRADLHTLFDLALIAIDAERLAVVVAPKLVGTEGERLSGSLLHLPAARENWPSLAALRAHREWAGI